MSINLQKGAKINLTKDNPGLSKIRIGTSWLPVGVKESSMKPKKRGGFLNTLGSVLKGEARIGDVVNSAVDDTRELVGSITDRTSRVVVNNSGYEIDVDTSILLFVDDKLQSKRDVVYYGNREFKGVQDIIYHMGDDTTGRNKQGIKDNESIIINLPNIPSQYNRLKIVSNIYDCAIRKQHFGMIGQACIRIIDAPNDTEIAKYNLAEDYNGYTSIEVADIYRHNGEWKFSAIGNPGNARSINEITRQY